MCWQGVHYILPLLVLVGHCDFVRASRDCGEDILVKLGDANGGGEGVCLPNGNTDNFDLLPEFPPIQIPCVAIPGAELATFEESTLPKRVFFPKGGSGRSTSGSGEHDPLGTQGTGSGTQGTGGSTQGEKSRHYDNTFSPYDSSGEKDDLSWTGRRKEKDSDSPEGGSPDDRNESYAASSSGPRSFKTVSPTTTTRGTDSRVTASSSVAVASVNALSISPTIAAATSGASNTRFALIPVVFACLALVL